MSHQAIVIVCRLLVAPTKNLSAHGISHLALKSLEVSDAIGINQEDKEVTARRRET
jgi:hypothetical protein